MNDLRVARGGDWMEQVVEAQQQRAIRPFDNEDEIRHVMAPSS